MKTRKPNEVPPSLKSIDIKAILRKRGVYLIQRRNQELKEMALPIVREMRKNKGKAPEVVEDRKHPVFTNDQINEYWQKQIHVVEVVEKQFESKLNQFIDNITKGVLAHLDEFVATEKSIKKYNKDYFDDNEDALLTKAQLDFRPLLENVAVLAGTEANKLIGVSDPYVIYNYRQQIEKNVDKFTQSLIDTDKEHLTNIIVDGIKQGRSVPEIRSEIEKSFEEYNKNQAQRITRTEVLRVSNQASLDSFKQSGVVEGKQWVTYGAVDECAAYDGKIETLTGSFYSSDNEFQDGDPPLHPNCKCVLIPIVEKGEKTYQPDNSKLLEQIKELEGRIDKRTKAYKELKAKASDDKVYIKSLEQFLGLSDEPNSKAEKPKGE